MTIQNIRIDTTTRSTVFNPLSASGQWLCSTFGKRTIGIIDAQYPVLVDATQDLPDLTSITLYSEFGDALEWQFVSSFVQVMTIQGVYTMIETYGMVDKSVVNKIKDCSVEVIFAIDGIHEQSGKVFLHSDWDIIKENILILGSKARVKFYKFKHNAHQQPAIEKFCDAVGATFEVLEDPLFGRSLFSVIDEHGKWLYDIHPASSSQPTLQQTMNGWNTLKTKIKVVQGKSIEEVNPITLTKNASGLKTDDMISVTIKGHVIQGSARAQVFSNALCDDWTFEDIDKNNSYNLSTVYELIQFAEKDLSAINIYKTDIKDILEI